MEAATTVIGGFAMVAGGGLLVLTIFFAVFWALGVVGKAVFKRLLRVYHLTVIGYWLDRLEKGGWREFQKAEEAESVAARTSGEASK